MTAKELKSILSGIPDESEIVIKVEKYVRGNFGKGILSHSNGYETVDVDNCELKPDFYGKETLFLECCMCME